MEKKTTVFSFAKVVIRDVKMIIFEFSCVIIQKSMDTFQML